nr:tyrosine-type recombinase/integrase [Cognatishimia sp. MH4019]
MLPSRPPNAVRSQSLAKQVDWALLQNAKTVGQSAINKNLLGVKRTLDYAFLETAIFNNRDWRNPFDGFSRKPGKPKNPIKPFTPNQLTRVFSSEVYRTKTVEKFWIPLVLFYTGARLDEISQLHVDDIKMEPLPHILAENLEDEDQEIAKKLKTESSHRTIPIHHKLITTGFLNYVAAIRSTGARHLFPGLPHKKGRGSGDLVSRDFITRFRNVGERDKTTGLNTRSLVTHSLRHSFRTFALYLPDQMFVQIAMGHYVSGESIQTYGRQAYLMPDLLHQKVFKDIDLPPIDDTFIQQEAERYLSAITIT